MQPTKGCECISKDACHGLHQYKGMTDQYVCHFSYRSHNTQPMMLNAG